MKLIIDNLNDINKLIHNKCFFRIHFLNHNNIIVKKTFNYDDSVSLYNIKKIKYAMIDSTDESIKDNIKETCNNLLEKVYSLYIYNNKNCHYEIIESIIVKNQEIIHFSKIDFIYIYCHPNKSFEKYISLKYKNIFFGKREKYDYYINTSTFPEKYDFICKQNKKIIIIFAIV